MVVSELVSETASDSSKAERLETYPLEGRRPLEAWVSCGSLVPAELGGEDGEEPGVLGERDIRLKGGVAGGVRGPSVVSHRK